MPGRRKPYANTDTIAGKSDANSDSDSHDTAGDSNADSYKYA